MMRRLGSLTTPSAVTTGLLSGFIEKSSRRWSSSPAAASRPSPPLPSYKASYKPAAAATSPSQSVNLAERLRRSSCAEDTGPVQPRHLSPLQKRQLQMKHKQTFTLTPQAARRVKYLLERYETGPAAAGGSAEELESPTGIRIGVRRRGCSGYSYTVNYYFPPSTPSAAAESSSSSTTSSPSPSSTQQMLQKKERLDLFAADADSVVQQDGLTVVVASDALFYVIGTVMDFITTNVEEKFIFRNPNKKYSCGCEESFMPFDEDDD